MLQTRLPVFKSTYFALYVGQFNYPAAIHALHTTMVEGVAINCVEGGHAGGYNSCVVHLHNSKEVASRCSLPNTKAVLHRRNACIGDLSTKHSLTVNLYKHPVRFPAVRSR